MKVVLNTIKRQIDEAIKTHTAEKIARVELNNDEFGEFIISANLDGSYPITVKINGDGKYEGYLFYNNVHIQCVDIKDDEGIVKEKGETIHLEPWRKYDEYGRCD